jgi:hypothetical protein
MPMYYNHGYEENNIDEYYSGTCSRCNKFMSWEPNYDCYDSDVIKLIYDRNIVVIGDYLQFTKPNHATDAKISEEMFNDIIDTHIIYEIDAPKLLTGPNKR